MQTTPLQKWLLTLVGAMVVIVLGAGIWFYRAQEEHLRANAESELHAIARLKVTQITEWRTARLADAAILLNSPLFIDGIAHWLASPQTADTKPILTRFHALREFKHYSNVLFVDPTGAIRLHVGANSERLHPDAAPVIAQARSHQRPVLTDLHLSPVDQHPHLGVVAPLFTRSGAAPRYIGAVILQIAAADYLYPLVQSWPTPSRTAETLLVRRDGDSVLFLNNLRHRPQTALALRIPLSQRNVPAVMAVRGRVGVVQGTDYRGVPVVSVIQPIPDSPWFMVAKVDATEVFARWRFRSRLIIAVLLLGITLVGAAGLVVWQQNQKSHYRKLFQSELAQRASEARYGITLQSIGDAVIATDANGRVTMLNPVAEALTGWTTADACGRPLDEVFHIINEESRHPVESPVTHVLREGVIVGLANHTVLIACNGVEHPIADSGAPIRDAQGTIIGVVLVFRDVTTEQQHHRQRDHTVELLRLLNARNSTQELLREVTAFLQQWTRCEAVGVRLREGEDFPYFETRGFSQDFVREETHLCVSTPEGLPVKDANGNPVLACMCGNILCGRSDPSRPFFTARGSFWTNSTTDLLATTTDEDRQACSRNRCTCEGYESVTLIPLRYGAEILGLLQLNDHARDRFTPELIAFLESSADQIAIALAHRQAQEALATSEARYRALFEHMTEGFFQAELLEDAAGQAVDFRFLDVNPAHAQIIGLPRDAVVGKTARELFPDLEASWLEAVAQVVRTGEPLAVEGFVRATGRYYANSYFSPLPGQFASIFSDITSRKQGEAERERLATAIAQAAEIIIITDRDGTIQYANPAFETVTGYTCSEALGQTPRLLKSDMHDAAFYRALWDTIVSGQTWEGRIVNRKKDGRLFTDEATISPVRAADGTIINYVAVMRDITHELDLEAQYLQAQKMEVVGRLAGGIAHDFNNILTGVLGFTDLAITRVPAGSPLEEDLAEVRRLGLRAADLTRQLLAFSRRQALEMARVDLNALVEKTHKMLERVLGEDIGLQCDLCGDLSPVKGDASQLEQVILNLAINARDAMPNGGQLTLETANVTLGPESPHTYLDHRPGTYVMLALTDTGLGMDAATLAHLFEPFFTTKDSGKGTGLGLATVYGIIKQHDGSIYVYSEPGTGTTFKIYLPCLDEHCAPRPTPGDTPITGTETILLVEDEETVRVIAQRILVRLGYTVLTAVDGADAERQFLADPARIHLLLTDVVMPGINGRELYHRLITTAPALKVLYMSGYTPNAIVHHGILDAGISLLSKPFTADSLGRKVRDVLDQ